MASERPTTPADVAAAIASLLDRRVKTVAVNLSGSEGDAGRDPGEALDDAFRNPMTSVGDLIVGTTDGAPARLAKGADGQVLAVDPTTHLLRWTSPSGVGSGGTGILGLVTVDPGTVTYDDSGPDVVVTIASVWGEDASGPYFDALGVTAGDEAALLWDPADESYVVSRYHAL